jgi:hypothetical protein
MKTTPVKEELLIEVPDESTEMMLTEVPPTEEGELLIESKKPLDDLVEKTASAIEDFGAVGDLSTGATEFIDGPAVAPKKPRAPKAPKKADKPKTPKAPKKVKAEVEEVPVQREYTPEQRKKLLQNYSKRTLITRFGIKF